MPRAGAVLAALCARDQDMGHGVHTRCPHLLPSDGQPPAPVPLLAHGACSHVGRIRAMFGSVSPTGADLAIAQLLALHRELRLGGEVPDISTKGLLHERMFVLQIVVQAQALRCEMLADHAMARFDPPWPPIFPRAS